MYNEKVMELFKNPRNIGKIKDADGVGKVENPKCGDKLELYIKVENEIITDVKSKTSGCAAAIAASSIITEMVKDKNLDEVMNITGQDVVDELGGLPLFKIICSYLAVDALHAAIEDYCEKKGEPVKEVVQVA